MRGSFITSETPPGYEALRAFWAARRAHLPLQMRAKEVGDAVCPQLAVSDRLSLRSRKRRFESSRRFVYVTARSVVVGASLDPVIGIRHAPAPAPSGRLGSAAEDIAKVIVTAQSPARSFS